MVNEGFLSELQSQHPLLMPRVISVVMICEGWGLHLSD